LVLRFYVAEKSPFVKAVLGCDRADAPYSLSPDGDKRRRVHAFIHRKTQRKLEKEPMENLNCGKEAECCPRDNTKSE